MHRGAHEVEPIRGARSADGESAVRDVRVVASAPSRERLEQIEDKKGTTEAIEGDPRLAEAALDAVRQWRYEPVVRDGAPVEAKLTAVVSFSLQ